LLGRRHGEEGGEAQVAEAVADAQKHHLAWPRFWHLASAVFWFGLFGLFGFWFRKIALLIRVMPPISGVIFQKKKYFSFVTNIVQKLE
jgi:hypothetical protein